MWRGPPDERMPDQKGRNTILLKLSNCRPFYDIPTPLAHADTSRDVLPRRGTSHPLPHRACGCLRHPSLHYLGSTISSSITILTAPHLSPNQETPLQPATTAKD
ncbi:hypothetical protein TNCV_140421 [Trichonephila clavipes]|uniref:Uncharacterized protein n=1 Tax=Trichonephila clavipes TaxID=2585209 RepID=A0A8X6RDP7_TRICX|nr:hypothetical protein TNCV_140421 [Trichonephila clavipes]